VIPLGCSTLESYISKYTYYQTVISKDDIRLLISYFSLRIRCTLIKIYSFKYFESLKNSMRISTIWFALNEDLSNIIGINQQL